MDLTSHIFWTLASIAIMASALYADRGPVKPVIAESSAFTQDAAG